MALKDTSRDVMCQITSHKSASFVDREIDAFFLILNLILSTFLILLLFNVIVIIL